VARTEIGEEACSFLGVSARALVVVVGDVAEIGGTYRVGGKGSGEAAPA
jgi:hypothetical protein